MRAFSLLETMVTVAVLSVITALALPNLTPEVQKTQLATAVNAVATFVTAARDEAISARRCARVRIPAVDVLVLEVANTLSCEQLDDAVPPSTLIDPGAPAWIEVRRLKLESPRVFADFLEDPPLFGAVPQLRFRSTGRVFSRDDIVDDDHVAIEVVHPALSVTRHVLIRSNGFTCIPPPGVVQRGAPTSSFTCERGP